MEMLSSNKLYDPIMDAQNRAEGQDQGKGQSEVKINITMIFSRGRGKNLDLTFISINLQVLSWIENYSGRKRQSMVQNRNRRRQSEFFPKKMTVSVKNEFNIPDEVNFKA
jgi:hypothetical protein